MRPVEFGEALASGTRLTLFSDDKPDRFFTVIKFWMDETSGVALALSTSCAEMRFLSDESLHLILLNAKRQLIQERQAALGLSCR